MNTPLKQKEAAMAILSNASKSTDLKLYQLFELYKDDLRKENSPLYYALLDWADKHAHDLVDNDTLRTELYKNLLEERSTARKCTFRQMGECGRHSECLRCRYAKDVNDLFNQFLEIPVDANGCIAHSFLDCQPGTHKAVILESLADALETDIVHLHWLFKHNTLRRIR